MIINFKIYKINWDIHKLIQTSTLIIIKKNSLQTHTQLIDLFFREKINKCILAQTFQAWCSWDKNQQNVNILSYAILVNITR